MNGSCGNRKRGCEIDYSLPHDSVLKPVSAKMLRDRNDIQTVLFSTGAYSNKIMEKERPLEKVAYKTPRSLRLL